MAVIVAVKQGDMSRATTLARQVSFDISKTDCDGVILGCTELPLVGVSLIPPSCQAIDTLEILADTCAQQVQSIEMKGKHYDSRPIYA